MLPLLELLKSQWGIGTTDMRLLQEGNGRRITRVESPHGSFVAKELAASEGLCASLAVLQEVQRQGFRHAPRLLPTSAGEVVHMSDRAVYVMAAVEGTQPSRDPNTQQELGSIARALNEITGVQHRRLSAEAVIADLMQRDEGLQLGPEYARLVNDLEVLCDQPLALVHGEINRPTQGWPPTGRSCCSTGTTWAWVCGG